MTSPLKDTEINATDEFFLTSERNVQIAEVAYLKAEQRGFAPGHELDDWLLAEREIR